jgi:hypothetical protein
MDKLKIAYAQLDAKVARLTFGRVFHLEGSGHVRVLLSMAVPYATANHGFNISRKRREVPSSLRKYGQA